MRPGVPEGASTHGPLAVATPGLVAGLELALELATHDWESLRAQLVAAIEARFASGHDRFPAIANRRLLTALTSDRSGVARFVSDLAEILWLPREQRSEYALCRSGSSAGFGLRLRFSTKRMR